jgi:hypothetical protein
MKIDALLLAPPDQVQAPAEALATGLRSGG